jgi:hypothetical protein
LENEMNGHHDTVLQAAARLIEMAAVVGAFDPLALIQVATGDADASHNDNLLDELARHSDEVPVNGGYLWQLKGDARRNALATLGRSGRLLAIIAATPPAVSDRFGKHLQAVLGQDRNDLLHNLPSADLNDLAIALDFARDSLSLSWSSFLPEDPRAVLARRYADTSA